MEKIKKGDIVARKSYGCDILFFIDKIIVSSNNTAIAILKGITIRILADAFLDDLFIIDNNLFILFLLKMGICGNTKDKSGYNAHGKKKYEGNFAISTANDFKVGGDNNNNNNNNKNNNNNNNIII